MVVHRCHSVTDADGQAATTALATPGVAVHSEQVRFAAGGKEGFDTIPC